MRRARLNTSAFRDHMVVRMGIDGPLGCLVRRQKRDGNGVYWQVKLERRLASGQEWYWPEGKCAERDGGPSLGEMVLDGPGSALGRCCDCGLPMMVPVEGDEGLCRYCDEAAHGSPQERAAETDDPVARRNWLRSRQRAAAADDPEVPF